MAFAREHAHPLFSRARRRIDSRAATLLLPVSGWLDWRRAWPSFPHAPGHTFVCRIRRSRGCSRRLRNYSSRVGIDRSSLSPGAAALESKTSRLRGDRSCPNPGLHRSTWNNHSQRLPRRLRGWLALRSLARLWPAIFFPTGLATTACDGRALSPNVRRAIHQRGNRSAAGKDFAQRDGQFDAIGTTHPRPGAREISRTATEIGVRYSLQQDWSLC